VGKATRSKKSPTAKELRAWREARVINYVSTRSIDALARMVVELEDSAGHMPEFDFDEEWPEAVASLKP
jgi:hypothetical protein